MRSVSLAVALLLALAGAAQAQTVCPLKVKASLDLDMLDSGVVTVPATLDGKPFHMLVDTGDYFSTVTQRTATTLGLEEKPSYGDILIGWGGVRIKDFVKLQNFRVGRMQADDQVFFVLPGEDPPFDGLFGADFLYFFDLEFDFEQARLDLISPDHCKGVVVSWTKQPYAAIPFDYRSRKIRLDVTLDGKEVQAILDTGASDTVLSLEKAADLFDLDEDALAKEAHHPFKNLSMGGVGVNNPVIELVPDKQSGLALMGGPKMIIGMNVLRQLHLYIAYHEGMIYATPAAAR